MDGYNTFVKQVSPYISFFYSAAYAIAGNRGTAERVLIDALTRSYFKDAVSSPMGIRDAIVSQIRAAAFERLDDAAAANAWQSFGIPETVKSPILQVLKNENAETQRLAVLRFGCAMTHREIARVTSLTDEEIREKLSVFKIHLEGELKARNRSGVNTERACMKAIRQQMNAAGRIDSAFVLHEVEQEVSGRQKPKRLLIRTVKVALFCIFGMICSLILWAVLILVLA